MYPEEKRNMLSPKISPDFTLAAFYHVSRERRSRRERERYRGTERAASLYHIDVWHSYQSQKRKAEKAWFPYVVDMLTF